MRRHPRFPVDWLATFHVHAHTEPTAGAHSDGAPEAPVAARETPVRIFELSQSGASIETLPGLVVGDRGTLVLHQIAGQPTIQVTVMDARRPLGRAGLRFDDSDEIAARLALLASGVRR
jgi:hypothetical protein